MFTASREFHALPIEEKLALRLAPPVIPDTFVLAFYNANYVHRKEFAGHSTA